MPSSPDYSGGAICAPLQIPTTPFPAAAISETAAITSSFAASAPARTRSSNANPPGTITASHAQRRSADSFHRWISGARPTAAHARAVSCSQFARSVSS